MAPLKSHSSAGGGSTFRDNLSIVTSRVTAFTAAAWTVSLVACARGSPAHLVEQTHLTMGSELRVTAWTTDEARAHAAFEAVFGEFDRLDGMMSVWKKGSDIVRLNEAAGERPVPVSPETREVLGIAHQVSEWTGGRFDVTFGALSGLWKFDDQDRDNTIPERADVLARLPLVNYRDLVVDERAGTAFLKRKGMRAHLGGIGKGYAVDRAVDILHRSGLRDFMVQAGGDLYVAGSRGDRPWRLGIRDPRGPADTIFAALELTDATFSTSGDYERFFMKDGRRYHHILDLTAGEPARGCRSVTLVTDRAVIADALAKGVFVLGPDAGMTLIERTPGVHGVIVGAKNEVLISSGLRSRIVLVAPPTDAP
jgi:thiamine biosynthesis lipoprotein